MQCRVERPFLDLQESRRWFLGYGGRSRSRVSPRCASVRSTSMSSVPCIEIRFFLLLGHGICSEINVTDKFTAAPIECQWVGIEYLWEASDDAHLAGHTKA